MRGKGINYDTGTDPAGQSTRPVFDPDVVRREMAIIADGLHCTAVRITGADPARIALAGRHAADAGLEVWFAPFLCELTTQELRPLLAECAERAEELRRGGAEVVLVTGAELGVFGRGFLPGDDLFARVSLFTSGRPDLRDLLAAVPPRLNAFLADVVADARRVFGGRVTYASVPFERVDWTPFDIVGADAYRGAHNAGTYREEVRALHRRGLPVAVTEFGCCTYHGAADQGGRGWLIVERDGGLRRLDGDYRRDEAEQAAYLTDLLGVLDEEGVDSAFWFTFAGYPFPHAEGPRADLDLASYGVVQVTERPGTAFPGLNLEPKEAFHAMATAYGG